MRSLNGGVSRIESVVAEVSAKDFRRLKKIGGKTIADGKKNGHRILLERTVA
ncbi:MAG: hypothetical protein GY748_13770 [Planctomycetaceae bacterium]|nr:hypothetical protein [Planctomycetaceae bacterium]